MFPVVRFPKILTDGMTKPKYESVTKDTVLGIKLAFLRVSILFFLESL